MILNLHTSERGKLTTTCINIILIPNDPIEFPKNKKETKEKTNNLYSHVNDNWF